MHIYAHNRRTRHRQETQAQESPPRQGALAPRRLIGPVLLNDGCGRRGERRASGSVGRAGSSNVWSVRARTGLRLPVEGEDGDRPLVHLAHAKARVVRLDAAVGAALVVVVGADLGASGERRGTGAPPAAGGRRLGRRRGAHRPAQRNVGVAGKVLEEESTADGRGEADHGKERVGLRKFNGEVSTRSDAYSLGGARTPASIQILRAERPFGISGKFAAASSQPAAGGEARVEERGRRGL